MTDRTHRQGAASGTVAEARSAAALFLSFTAVIAAAIALACLADGQSGIGIGAAVLAAASFVVSIICFSADAEPLAAPEQSPAALAAATAD